MKKFTNEITALLSTALIGTAGVCLMTSCGEPEYLGGLQKCDDQIVTTTEETIPYVGGYVDLMTEPCETTQAVSETEEPLILGYMSVSDEEVTDETEKMIGGKPIDLHPTEGVAMPDDY